MAVKCDNLIYTIVDALSFRIDGDTHTLTPVKKDNVIQYLDTDNGPIFTLGLTVEIRRRKYKVNIIEQFLSKRGVYYIISIAKRTKASTFLLPMLGGHRNLFFCNKLLLNCFIKTEEDKNCIALLYRWSSDPVYIKFEKALTKFKAFKRRYDPTPNCVMFVFNIPKRHIRNYTKFIKGKYSKLSESYKFAILDFHDKDIDDAIGQVLFRSEKRKRVLERKLGEVLPEDSEVLSVIDPIKETYNPETYKFKKLI